MNRPRADIDPRWRILLSCLLASAMLAPPSSAFADDPPSHASDTTTTTEDPTPTSTVEILNRSAERIQIGQPLHLRVHVHLPDNAQLVSLRPANNPFVERVSDIRRAPAARTGLAVTIFRPGTYRFSIEALWIDSQGHQHSTHSKPLRIQVTSSLKDPEDAELSPPGAYVILRSRNLGVILGGIALLVLAFAGFAYLIWRKLYPKPIDVPPPPPPRPAWKVALESIDALRNDTALLNEDPVQFHHRISEILRVWVQGRFNIRAPEMTTEEILAEIAPRRLALGGWIEEIHTILADSDLVKFAKFTPSASNSLTLLQQLEDLVREVQESDASPPPDIPAPIEGDEPPVEASEAAAPQQHQPGAAEPRYTPENLPKPNILSLNFRRDKSAKKSARSDAKAPTNTEDKT